VGIAWGVVLIAVSSVAWIGQLVSLVDPDRAARLGLTEADEDVDPVFAADVRGEAAWDTLTLWCLLVAGILLVADVEQWAYFGLVGGGIFLYFAGRGIATRVTMRSRGHRIGTEANVRAAMVMLACWAVAAIVTIWAAVVALTPR
jgi:hypothetical protein